MSNRAVSATYRAIIDDVMANIRQDFEDMGIEMEILNELQQSWETKIVATGVADFEGAGPVQPAKSRKQQQKEAAEQRAAAAAAAAAKAKEDKEGIKKDEAETSASGSGNKALRVNGAHDVHGGQDVKPEGQATFLDGVRPDQVNGQAGVDPTKINGTAENGHGNGNGDNKRKRPISDDNEIGSDLDDSDDDEMEGHVDADGNEDMILCLYDKVQRVRNKWKCILKDGVASIDGRDYVFSKLSSELEW